MALLKINDEKTRQTIRSGKLQTPYYSYRGQEAIPSAVSANLTDEDYICTIYRGIHDMLAKGMPLRSLWAEIAGRSEEHTSELQSLMRISYAVFCLKTKKTKHVQHKPTPS